MEHRAYVYLVSAWVVGICPLLRSIENLLIQFLSLNNLFWEVRYGNCRVWVFTVSDFTPVLLRLLFSRHFLSFMLQYTFVLMLMACGLWNNVCLSLGSVYCVFTPVLLWPDFGSFGMWQIEWLRLRKSPLFCYSLLVTQVELLMQRNKSETGVC